MYLQALALEVACTVPRLPKAFNIIVPPASLFSCPAACVMFPVAFPHNAEDQLVVAVVVEYQRYHANPRMMADRSSAIPNVSQRTSIVSHLGKYVSADYWGLS